MESTHSLEAPSLDPVVPGAASPHRPAGLIGIVRLERVERAVHGADVDLAASDRVYFKKKYQMNYSEKNNAFHICEIPN